MVFSRLSPKLQKLIEKKGFAEPTVPQKIAIPKILKGENVLILSGTGSGKTLVAMLPLFDMVTREKRKPISILYINPLRSLSRDLLDRLFWWGDKLDLDVCVRHGDTSQQERKMQADSPPDCLITTPETLGAMLIGKKLREHLKNVKYVVIDEVHELVDNKRGVQLSLLLERLKALAGDFQRIGLSATVGDPKSVANFIGKNVKIVKADYRKRYEIKVEIPSSLEIPDTIFMNDDTFARLMRIRQLINEHKSVLTFTNTRETAEVLSSRFRTIDKSLRQEVHHGSLSKEKRIESEKKFKNEEIKALIATSSLELGIDIGSIDLVIQYLSPRQVSKLIQRIGRSGHKVGEKSKGIVLTDEYDVFESVVIAQKAINKEIEKTKIHEMAKDVLATQIIGLGLEEYGITTSKIYNIIKNAYPFRKMTKDELIELVKFLKDLRLIWLEPHENDFSLKRTRRSWDYYFNNLSTIPDTRQVNVISIVENEPVGSLDEAFVAEHGQIGNTFICSGRAWKILSVEDRKVIVEPVDDVEGAIPAWEGELIPVPFEVAQDVGRLRKYIASNLNKNIKEKLKNYYSIDDYTVEKMLDEIKKQKEKHSVPDNDTFLLESYKNFVILHSCCGSLINDTIGRYVASIITAETGVAVNIKTDPYRIIFQTPVSAKKIKSILQKAEKIEDVLRISLEQSSMFKWRFIHVAKRFGIISRNARYDNVSINKIISQYRGTPVHEEAMRELFIDKMDVSGAEKIIEEIKKGKIKIKIEKGLSYFGEIGLVKQFSEVMKPRMPKKEIFEAFKKRLMLTRVRLACINCGSYSLSKIVKDVEDQPICPKCNSGLIAVLHPKRRKPLEIIKKYKSKKTLTKDEMKLLKEIKRSASLTMTYGKKYAIVMAGHGIGVETAARILSRMPKNEEQLLKYIFEAEKQYTKTKMYWR